MSAETYWEQRAQRFAHRGDGLAAVCSYGMPALYNRTIQLSQRRADAVVNYLSTKYNIPPHKFYLIGIGKDQQVASNSTRLRVYPSWRAR